MSVSKGGTYNPHGINQHPPTVKADDPTLRDALFSYQTKQIYNSKRISELLLKDHGISMSPRTVERRRQNLGLMASGKSTKAIPDDVKRQAIAEAMENDPAKHQGPRVIQEELAHAGMNLTRDYISSVMHDEDPDGFVKRHPAAKKIPRVPLTSAGPNDEWAGDGHDKLNGIGIGIYGIRDKASGYWLGLWATPTNRDGKIVAYLYLSLVAKHGGIPRQSTSDCGSETTWQYGFAHALRDMVNLDTNDNAAPAHRFLRSIHNIVIEKGWWQLTLRWGHNIIEFYNYGIKDGTYDINIESHRLLATWLWSTFIKADLEILRQKMNAKRMRKDKNKILPSGESSEYIYSSPEKFGMHNCIQPVDIEPVKAAMEELGGETLLDFVPSGYAVHAQQIYEELGSPLMQGKSLWGIFRAMLPLM